MNQLGFGGTQPHALSKQLAPNQHGKWSGQTLLAAEMFSKITQKKTNSIASPHQYHQYQTGKQALAFKGVIKPSTTHLTRMATSNTGQVNVCAWLGFKFRWEAAVHNGIGGDLFSFLRDIKSLQNGVQD